MDFFERLERLARVILRKTCVLFVGAGPSQTAQSADNDIPLFQLGSEFFCEGLQSAICNACDDNRSCDNCVVSPAKYPNLAELSEFAASILSPEQIYDSLKIRHWATFQPAAFHRCLALLAREGLIEEVLTTNYDQLLERAYCDTFENNDEGSMHCPVIYDRSSYSRHYSRNTEDDIPLLKILKICGCSSSIKNPEDGTGDLILSDRDLQYWRDRQWAKDLLRNRLRSHSLLFVGFEGKDPIVRHHAIQITEELMERADPQNSPWDLQNAPYIMSKDSLSFYQLQILQAFYRANTDTNSQRLARNIPDLIAELSSNVFDARDVEQLKIDNDKWNADYFFSQLVRTCIRTLLHEKYLDINNSAISSYLSGALKDPSILLGDVLRELVWPDESVFLSWITPDANGSIWGTIVSTLNGERPTPFRYRSFLESQIKLPMLLIIKYLVQKNTVNTHLEDLKTDCPFLVCLLKMNEDYDTEISDLYVFDWKCLEQILDGLDVTECGLRAHSILVGLGGSGDLPRAEYVTLRCKESNRMTVRLVWIVPDLFLLAGERFEDKAVTEVINRVKVFIEDPCRIENERAGWQIHGIRM